MLIGVNKGYDVEEIKQLIIEQNAELTQYGVEQNELKFILKRTCRSHGKENWTFQIKPILFKKIMQVESINLDLVKIRLVEAESVGRCFRCNGYGNIQKHCKDKRLVLDAG